MTIFRTQNSIDGRVCTNFRLLLSIINLNKFFFIRDVSIKKNTRKTIVTWQNIFSFVLQKFVRVTRNY